MVAVERMTLRTEVTEGMAANSPIEGSQSLVLFQSSKISGFFGFLGQGMMMKKIFTDFKFLNFTISSDQGKWK